MGIDNNSTVAISITVRDDGSIALIDAAESKLIKLQNVSVGAGSAAGKLASNFGLAGANLGAFGTSVSSTTQHLTGFASAAMTSAAAAENAGARTEASFHAAGGAVQGVRLAVQELGLRVPRAMESIIAHNEALAAGLQATMGIFVAMGAIAVFAQMAKGAYDLYQEWFNVDKAVEDYNQKAQQAARQKLFEEGSIETTASMLESVGDELDRLQAKRAAFDKQWSVPGTNIVMPGAGALQYGQYLNPAVALGIQKPTTWSDGDDKAAANLAEKQKKGQEHLLNSTDKVAEQQLQGQQAYDQAVNQGYAKIDAHEKDTIALINQRYAIMRANEADLAKTAGIKPIDLDKSYGAEQQAEVKRVQQESAGQRVAMAHQEADEEIRMRNEAIDAGVRGEALYAEQAQQAEDAIRKKIAEGKVSREIGMKEITDLDMKYHNAKMQRLDEENHATLEMQQEAQGAGLTGIPKLEHDRQSALGKVEHDANKGDFQNPDTVPQRRATIDQQTNQDILEAHQQFQQEMDQIAQRSDQAQLAGYARIEAETKGMLARIAEDYKKTYGQLADADPAKIVGTQKEQAAITAVTENAQRERAQYARQIDQQITQLEAEAAKASLSPWQAAQEQIIEQYQQRVEKARAELNMQLSYEKLTTDDLKAIWSQYYRTIAADGDVAAAQMQKQMEQTRDQVASQLEQMFSNPAKYMENRAKQMMMDIVANWVTQLMQASPQMQGAIGGILGMNKMGTSANPLDAMKSMFGGHADAGGSTLMSAGSTLSSSGTMLAGSASRLSASATALMQAASSFSSSSGTSAGGGAGQIGQLSDMMTGAGTSGGTSIGGFGGSSFASQAASLPETPGGLSGAVSMANTVAGAAGVGGQVSSVTGMVSTAGQLAQQAGLLGGSTQMLNPGGAGGFGGLQSTDLPPTNSAGVLGTVPNSPTGTGGTDAGAAGAANVGIGAGLAAISTGMALSQEWQSGNQNGAILTGAMGGASIGGMVGGLVGGPMGALIGMGVGAVGGALVGFIGSLFSDHGLSKAQHYNTDVVIPSINKDMGDFSGGGGGYDQASQDLNNVMVQAQQQCKSFGTAAVSYYNSTIVGEITAAQAQIDRMSKGGRANVTMSTAQFDSGGVVSSFGDMATGPFSGLVHLRMGERVMNPMASMMHAPLLDAMNSGSAALSAMRRSAPLQGSTGVAGARPIVIQTLDHKTMSHWLRMGGAQLIQSAINSNTASYAGKAVG